MDYTNSIYYTFSTISQVLAGFIALSGVFVLFKLQELKKQQLALVQYFLIILSNNRPNNTFYDCPQIAIKLKTLKESESTSGILNEITKILLDKEIINSPILKYLTNYQDLIEKIEVYKNKIRLLTKSSLFSGIVMIMYSLIILGNTHLIRSSLSNYILWSGIILTTIPIITMTKAIYLSLKDYNPITNP